jgi:hypothetical protein
MENLQYANIGCPYCGEIIEVAVDNSAGPQAYIEDCSICCRPIEIALYTDGADWTLSVRRDDE